MMRVGNNTRTKHALRRITVLMNGDLACRINIKHTIEAYLYINYMKTNSSVVPIKNQQIMLLQKVSIPLSTNSKLNVAICCRLDPHMGLKCLRQSVSCTLITHPWHINNNLQGISHFYTLTSVYIILLIFNSPL